MWARERIEWEKMRSTRPVGGSKDGKKQWEMPAWNGDDRTTAVGSCGAQLVGWGSHMQLITDIARMNMRPLEVVLKPSRCLAGEACQSLRRANRRRVTFFKALSAVCQYPCGGCIMRGTVHRPRVVRTAAEGRRMIGKRVRRWPSSLPDL